MFLVSCLFAVSLASDSVRGFFLLCWLAGERWVDTERSRCRCPGVGVCERLRCRWLWKERVVCFTAFSRLGSDERLMGEEGVWPGVGGAVGTGRGLGWERVLEPAGTPYLQLCGGRQNTVCT